MGIRKNVKKLDQYQARVRPSAGGGGEVILVVTVFAFESPTEERFTSA